MIVMKFGGSSIATPERIRNVMGLVHRELERDPVVVVSAHGGTTNHLIEAAREALSGTVDTSVVERYHLGLADELGVDRRVVEPLLEQLARLLHGICLLRELTTRTLDHVMSFGERMSTRMMAAAMAGEGIPATAVNAWDLGLMTSEHHGSAVPLPGIEESIAGKLAAISLVPVVTGFLGKSPGGDITTLGRSGSDFTASIIGAAVQAREVQIWTDVDGVMTCDPTVDPTARSLPVLTFEEASELAYYGAQVLHPSTLVPAIRKHIPVRVLNTSRPEGTGTKVVAEPVHGDRIAKSVVYKENVCMLGIASPRLMGAVEVLTGAFQRLRDHQVGIHMATTSEASVSLVTDRTYGADMLGAAVQDLQELGDVDVHENMTIICVVGEELRGRAGVAGRIFEAVERRGIKPRMISQSSSEINVAFLVTDDELEPAVRALHSMLLSSGTDGP